MSSKIGMIDYICVECNSLFELQRGNLQNRKIRNGEPICKKCYKRVSRNGKCVDFYPHQLVPFLEKDVWDYALVEPFFKELGGSKRKVKFVCQECGQEDTMMISMMSRRKICGTKPICRKCSFKFATSSDQWLDANSKAQLISQNRPEVLEKQRSAQKRLMQNDPLYCEKRCSKSYVSGTIRGMRFDSSWELYFIVSCWESDKVKSISRYNGNIKYIDEQGSSRRYYPDFLVKMNDGEEKIIEIKGSRKYNNFLEKFNAAREKHGCNYIVYEEEDLKDIGILFKKDSYLKCFYNKYYHEITFYSNKKTKNLLERITKWLK